jgi:hypothetical protein
MQRKQYDVRHHAHSGMTPFVTPLQKRAASSETPSAGSADRELHARCARLRTIGTWLCCYGYLSSSVFNSTGSSPGLGHREEATMTVRDLETIQRLQTTFAAAAPGAAFIRELSLAEARA